MYTLGENKTIIENFEKSVFSNAGADVVLCLSLCVCVCRECVSGVMG